MTSSLHLVLLLAALISIVQTRSQTRNILFDPLRARSVVDTSDLDDSQVTEPGEKEDTGGDVQVRSGSFHVTELPGPPVFVKPDKMHRIVAKPAGNMLRLKCPAEGNPAPNITWFKNDAVPERHHGTFRYGSWSITLEDLLTTDSGNYTCLVCNAYGCIHFTFKVNILERLHHSPTFTEAPKNTTVELGTSATFHCAILSDLHPHVDWHKGYVKSIDNYMAKARIDCGLQNGHYSTECKNPEILEIHNVTYDDAGWYTCVAGNSLGILYASAYLDVVETSSTILSQTAQ